MELRSEDITNDVCRRCARCCSIKVQVSGDHRHLELMELVYGERLTIKSREPCECGCKGEKFGGFLEDPCPHLVEEDGVYRCSVYETRPEFCRDYNCATWAMVLGHTETEYTRGAEEAIRRLAAES